MAFTLKNPEAPMSFKQGITIRNLGGGDVREEGFTMKQASDRIGELLASKGTTAKPTADFQDLWNKAQTAGMEAGEGLTPQPMNIVGYEPVLDGPCGFAWVNFKMKSGLARQFGKWLRKEGLGRKDEYYGGMTIWIGEHRQSMNKKAAHASSMANVLQEAGIEAHPMSRMD